MYNSTVFGTVREFPSNGCATDRELTYGATAPRGEGGIWFPEKRSPGDQGGKKNVTHTQTRRARIISLLTLSRHDVSHIDKGSLHDIDTRHTHEWTLRRTTHYREERAASTNDCAMSNERSCYKGALTRVTAVRRRRVRLPPMPLCKPRAPPLSINRMMWRDRDRLQSWIQGRLHPIRLRAAC